ncbi:MAG: DUF3048 domain-containing protein [Caldilineaceae bacterium]|nr:DUF3048 domain-containing protein [Caldilineaceae bacterium]
MKPILYTALLLLWLLAGCAPEEAPMPTAAAATPTAEETAPAPDTTQVGKLDTLLNAPVPTPRSAKAAPPLPGGLPTVTPTGAAQRPSALALLLPSPTPAPPDTATPSAELRTDGSVGDVTVNVRGGPGANYAIVGKLGPGAQVEIVGRTESGDWLRICCPAGQDGESWVSAEFVTPRAGSRPLSDLPLAAIPPTPAAPAGGDGGGSSGQSAASLTAAPGDGLPGPGSFSAPGGVNPLTGLPGGSGGRPLIVCINNDYAARPQLGIGQADVVYEYLMEGYGITRFSAIFAGAGGGQVGPVRSARLINYYMGALYDAGLVCSGASDPVRYLLKHQAPFPYMDIDLDDASNINYSVSIGGDYRTRLRTSVDQLRRWLADWGVEKPASIRGFTFGGAPGGGIPAATISIPYPSGTGSQVAYVYDGGSGRYLRSMGGGVHVDGVSGAQVAVENVIVQVVAHEATNIVEDSLGSTSIRINLFGSGPAIVFRDGQAFVGAWRSESRGDTPRFYDAQGAEIPLKPGKSWISVVPSSYAIGYQ